MQKLIITITSEDWDFENSLNEVSRQVNWWNFSWRDENDTESYEYRVQDIYK